MSVEWKILDVLVLSETIGTSYHRHTREIPEPAPSWFMHGAQIGGLRVFPIIKITVVRQVRMSPDSSAIWAWRQTRVKCSVACKDRGRICIAFVFAYVVGKDPKTPNLSFRVDEAITRAV